jgi:hypothetical protein
MVYDKKWMTSELNRSGEEGKGMNGNLEIRNINNKIINESDLIESFEEKKELYDRCYDEYKSGNYEFCLTMCKHFISYINRTTITAHNYGEIFNLIGTCYSHLRDFEGAIWWFERALGCEAVDNYKIHLEEAKENLKIMQNLNNRYSLANAPIEKLCKMFPDYKLDFVKKGHCFY